MCCCMQVPAFEADIAVARDDAKTCCQNMLQRTQHDGWGAVPSIKIRKIWPLAAVAAAF